MSEGDSTGLVAVVFTLVRFALWLVTFQGQLACPILSCLIIIDPETENLSVFSVDADTVLSNVAAVNPHTITLLIRKISM